MEKQLPPRIFNIAITMTEIIFVSKHCNRAWVNGKIMNSKKKKEKRNKNNEHRKDITDPELFLPS